MQPKNRKKLQDGISRGRMMLKKHLAWLPGFPVQWGSGVVHWQAYGRANADQTPEFFVLDRERLRSAEMAVSKLKHRFPKALPKLVGDVDNWLARMDCMLSVLKSAIHDGQASRIEDVLNEDLLPRRWIHRWSTMLTQHLELGDLLRAMAWIELTRRDPVARDQAMFGRAADLRWIQEFRRPLERLSENAELLGSGEHNAALNWQLRLCQLRDELPSTLVEAIAACLGSPTAFSVPLDQPLERLNRLRKALNASLHGNSRQVPVLNPSKQVMGEALTDFIHQAGALKSKPRKLLFQLLDAFFSTEIVERVEQLHVFITEQQRLLQRRLKQIESGTIAVKYLYQRRQLEAEMQRELEPHTSDARLAEHLGNCLTKLPSLPMQLVEAWLRLAQSFDDDSHDLPENSADRTSNARLQAGLLSHCNRDHDDPSDQSALTGIVQQLAAIVSRRGPSSLLKEYWSNHLSTAGRHDTEFIRELLFAFRSQPVSRVELQHRTLELFERVAYDAGIDSLDEPTLHMLPTFAATTSNLSLAVDVFAQLATDGVYYIYSEDDLRAAFAMADDPNQVCDILLNCEFNNHSEYLVRLLPALRNADLKAIVLERLRTGDQRWLERMSGITQLASSLNVDLAPASKPEGDSRWMEHYPSIFKPQLEALSRASNEAPKIADHILGKHFPQSANLRSQIEAINSQLALLQGPAEPMDSKKRTHLEQRRRNLQTRLEPATVTLSSQRIDNLSNKLRERWEYEVVNGYLQHCRQGIVAVLKSKYQLERFPDELLNEPYSMLLQEVMGLTGRARELGLELLFETLQRSTRSFDDEPANLAFRQKMADRGINMQPWLSNTFRVDTATKDGEAYRLSFTRDVVDFLLMGFHFNTCLSPGEFNFFSTITNAVDVNKRVLYGKTPAGNVIGRCLFALNANGEILSYYRYCHDVRSNFRQEVGKFADRLAEEMNTSLASSGDVATLVAASWHDDGPVSLTQDLFDEESDLRRSLRSVALEDALPKLIEIVSRETVASDVIQYLRLPEVANRPTLARQLLDEFMDDPMPQKMQIAVAAEAFQRGMAERARHVAERIHWSSALRLLKRTACDVCSEFHSIASFYDVFAMMADFHPSLALRAIRASRPVNIRDDLQDTHPVRRAALITVQRRLGRDKLADELAK